MDEWKMNKWNFHSFVRERWQLSLVQGHQGGAWEELTSGADLGEGNLAAAHATPAPVAASPYLRKHTSTGSELNGGPQRGASTSLPQNLSMWPYLEKGSFQIIPDYLRGPHTQ